MGRSLPRLALFIWQSLSCQKAMETRSRDGLGSVWSRNVCLAGSISDLYTPSAERLICSSAADEISGETVAIKLVSRVFDKAQLAKRALREVTLLRHFSGHGSITGLIDVEMASRDSNEMYVLLLIVFFPC